MQHIYLYINHNLTLNKSPAAYMTLIGGDTHEKLDTIFGNQSSHL